MKNFFICLALVYLFMFLGGSMLLDLSRHFYAFLGFIVLILAVPISAFEVQSEKLKTLETRIQEPENREGGSGEP